MRNCIVFRGELYEYIFVCLNFVLMSFGFCEVREVGICIVYSRYWLVLEFLILIGLV